MEKVILGLGSNIGNRSGFIKKAIKQISLIKGINVMAVSSLYETGPWGLINQRKFLNCIIICLSKLEPLILFNKLKGVEQRLGRKKRIKWGPREIDIDILFYGNKVIKINSFTVPHPMIEKRNFVLIPLNELIPDFIHPVKKIKVREILKACTDKSEAALYN